MFKMKFLLMVFIISFNTFSQINKDSLIDVIEEIENDSILKDTIFLQEVFIGKEKMDLEAKKQFLLLQNRVYKVYPFAKTAGERLSLMNKNLEKLTPGTRAGFIKYIEGVTK